MEIWNNGASKFKMKSLKLFIVTLMIYCTTNTQIRSYFVVFFSHSNLIRKFTVKRSQMFVFNPNTGRYWTGKLWRTSRSDDFNLFILWLPFPLWKTLGPNSSVIRQKGECQNGCFTYVCVSGDTKCWRAFSWNTRFEIRPFALLPMNSVHTTLQTTRNIMNTPIQFSIFLMQVPLTPS